MKSKSKHKFLKEYPTEPGRWRVLDFDYKSSFVVVAKLHNGQIVLESLRGSKLNNDLFEDKEHKVLFMKE